MTWFLMFTFKNQKETYQKKLQGSKKTFIVKEGILYTGLPLMILFYLYKFGLYYNPNYIFIFGILGLILGFIDGIVSWELMKSKIKE